jgi:hypothetical protein
MFVCTCKQFKVKWNMHLHIGILQFTDILNTDKGIIQNYRVPKNVILSRRLSIRRIIYKYRKIF